MSASGRPREWQPDWFLIGLALLFLVALIVGLARGAPAPRAKPMPPAPVLPPCSTMMTWKGIDAVTHFHADGYYACCWQGRWWDGTWRCQGGTLYVEEWPRDRPEARSRWGVKLVTATAGDMEGTAWRVRLLAERID